MMLPLAVHPEQARATVGSKRASKNPENFSAAMQIQGILTTKPELG
jgi:hypothetical protein